MLAYRLCSDERDKVYAALGSAKDDLGIVPDYNLSVENVWLDFAQRILLPGDFSVLYDADPSWTNDPQSFHPSFIPRLKLEQNHIRPHPLGGMDNPRYRAGISRSSNVLASKPTTIDIRGVHIDEVWYMDTLKDAMADLNIGRGSPFKPQLFEAYEQVEKRYHSTLGTSGNTPSKLASFKLTFWRTIHLGFCPKSNESQSIGRTDFRFLNYDDRSNITKSLKNRAFFMIKSGSIGLGPV